MSAEGAPGVLVFYAYADLRGPAGHTVEACLREAASQLRLRGRVRVAHDGCNAAVGGSLAALRCFCAAVSALPELSECSIDFQLSAAPEQPAPEQRAAAAFDSFSLRRSAELVTLGPTAPFALDVRPAPHATPAEFHALIAQAAAGTVLLDVRNGYEARIGAFAASGVPTVQPGTRTFAGFPSWLETALEQGPLAEASTVLTYCTGGVRCERASALLLAALHARGRRPAVVQLRGGITRYLQAAEAGLLASPSFFGGVNFVYDERGCEAPPDAVPFGACQACGAPARDYAPRARCPACRLLQLLCPSCAAQPPLRCPACQPPSPGPATQPRVRILCLHGFRQSSKGLAGRLAALRRRLAATAEFVFVDAPHALPPPAQHRASGEVAAPRRAWLVSPADAAWAAGAAAESLPPPPLACNSLEQPYVAQTEGWPASLAVITAALAAHAPVHCLFGLSQGAAAAAATCAALAQPGADASALRCVWLAGGFAPPALSMLFSQPLALPSLHCFGADDKHVPATASEALAACFMCGVTLRHAGGHVLPATTAAVGQYTAFLGRAGG